MDSLVTRLRSKASQENSKPNFVKDGMKRLAESVLDNGGKKRILGDITNRSAAKVIVVQKKTKENVKKPSPDSGLDVKSIKASLAKSASTSSISSTSSAKAADGTLYTTAQEDLNDSAIDISFIKSQLSKPPPGVSDFDATCKHDPSSASPYAQDIFIYYKEREKKFPIKKYLDKQTEMTKSMRSILVDWMVEVQESFELNHETLYLGVKLVDLYLMKNFVPKSKLQLIGATAVFVASKFDERQPPLVDDFLYICDDSYTRFALLDTEVRILKAVDYDLGIPVSYRFLRRYARCAGVSMELLTLARYILEISLMDYDLIEHSDSRMAAACLLLALKMKKQEWTPTFEYYTGYKETELHDLIVPLNKNIAAQPNKNLQTIYTKYSHPVFFEVTKIPPLKINVIYTPKVQDPVAKQ